MSDDEIPSFATFHDDAAGAAAATDDPSISAVLENFDSDDMFADTEMTEDAAPVTVTTPVPTTPTTPSSGGKLKRPSKSSMSAMTPSRKTPLVKTPSKVRRDIFAFPDEEEEDVDTAPVNNEDINMANDFSAPLADDDNIMANEDIVPTAGPSTAGPATEEDSNEEGPALVKKLPSKKDWPQWFVNLRRPSTTNPKNFWYISEKEWVEIALEAFKDKDNSNTGSAQKLKRINGCRELMEVEGKGVKVLVPCSWCKKDPSRQCVVPADPKQGNTCGFCKRNGKPGCQAGKSRPDPNDNETSLDITPGLINDISTNAAVAISSASEARKAFEDFQQEKAEMEGTIAGLNDECNALNTVVDGLKQEVSELKAVVETQQQQIDRLIERFDNAAAASFRGA
ncbi:hypothetical protein KCU93_g1325, partial [Aureobasidium melanogenum]